MNHKSLPILYFALGLIVMRWLAREQRAEAEVDLVTRLRQAGAL